MKNKKIVAGLIELKKLHGSCFIDPKLVSIYRNRQDTIVSFLKDTGYQEIHTPLFIPKNLLPTLENRVGKWLIPTFSGKDKRATFYLKPFFGYFGAIPFVLNNIQSHHQLPLYLIERGPLYGNFPLKWNLIKNSKEDYIGLQGILISNKQCIYQLTNQINKLFSFLGINKIRKNKENSLGVETIAFYCKDVFVGACFNYKDVIGKVFKVRYLNKQQKYQPVFWQSFYIPQNLIFLLYEKE
ncbi:MAG: hypothetical protein ABIG90_02340 [bacterium]